MNPSRTSKSIRNSAVAMALFVMTLAVQFFSRKVFLDWLGAEVLGLNTTASNLLEFLNLAEFGIGNAFASLLYKSVFDNNEEKICEILTLQGWFYRRIGLFLLIGGLILGCFFPLIFKKMTLPLWYAYASFGVLLFSSLLGYFFNFHHVLLLADQQDHKFMISFKMVLLLKVIFQMAAVRWLQNGYVWWLIIEALFAIIATLTLRITVRKSYPYLRKSGRKIADLRRSYPEVTRRARQIFYHKIGNYTVTQSAPIVIYGFTSLTIVTLYGNYMIIVYAITSLVAALFSSMGGAVGSIVSEGDRHKILDIFGELFSVRFLIIATLTFAMLLFSPLMITVWLGSDYLLPSLTVALITANMFMYVSRSTVDNFLLAYGLFSDVYSPLVLVSLNIGLSVLFGWLWGLNGIILGVGISMFVILFCWEPYYLFTRGFKAPYRLYISIYSKHVLCGGLAALPPLLLYRLLPQYESLVSNLCAAVGLSLLYLLILAFLLNWCHCGFDRFLTRLRLRK